MAHKHAAIKHLRQTKKRTEQNTKVKKSLSYLRKAALKAIAQKDDKNAFELYVSYQKASDRAARKNIIKKNTAARKKSRILKKVNALKKK